MTTTTQVTRRYREMLDNSLAHYREDRLIAGTYIESDLPDGSDWHGCSVGCHLRHVMPDATTDELDALWGKHRIVADYYGYPERIAQLQDALFERLAREDHRLWHVELAWAVNLRETSEPGFSWDDVCREIFRRVLADAAERRDLSSAVSQARYWGRISASSAEEAVREILRTGSDSYALCVLYLTSTSDAVWRGPWLRDVVLATISGVSAEAVRHTAAELTRRDVP